MIILRLLLFLILNKHLKNKMVSILKLPPIDLNLIFRSFSLEEEDKKPLDSGFKLARKQFFNFFIRSKNEKSNILIGKV